MKKILQALFLLFFIGPANAGNWNNPNPFVDMMRSMLDMFEMMQLYDDFSGQIGHTSSSLGYRKYMPPYPPAPPGGNPFKPQQQNILEGAWASQSRILLAIKQNYARMYWSQDQYKDFYLEILPERLRFTDAETGQTQEFEYRTQGNQLALRDDQGRMVQFFRLNSADTSQGTQPESNFWDLNQ
ncbi:MAG TPA: hypothetical protein ENG92_00770 [Thiolapillus brandeum]|uniref:Uncharacterized protein n=1 Tax=Thiolapillus brandeum TaxID=1076588 RepID=A0A831NT31_9GAMM|nr:hypothetical protein [Thiolapillus brandeum]